MSCRVALTCRNPGKAAPYERALERAGLSAALLTPEQPRSIDGFAGLVLSGGADVNPALYGQPRQPETQAADDERDRMEIALVREALAADLPVLAICRGIQLLNVALGGTLIQHVGNHNPDEPVRAAPAHDVIVGAGTRLAAIVGSGPLPVNSRHHQAVANPAPGVVISARSAVDGVIEAMEYHCKRFVIAVQWHPEDQAETDARQGRLFEAFARAAGATAGGCGSAR